MKPRRKRARLTKPDAAIWRRHVLRPWPDGVTLAGRRAYFAADRRDADIMLVLGSDPTYPPDDSNIVIAYLHLIAVCQLVVTAPVLRAQAVDMWNAWERADGNTAAAQATEKLAAGHMADLAQRPGRLERLVSAILAGRQWPAIGTKDFEHMAGLNTREQRLYVVACIVETARELEREMDAPAERTT